MQYSKNTCVGVVIVLVATFIIPPVVDCAAPIAQHISIAASPNKELVIKLRGYDSDGDVLKATLSPGNTNAGKVYQLRQH